MTDAIHLSVKGLKCDAPGCDYVDETVDRFDYDKWLNAPCPKCGAPLLTEADLAACKRLERAAAAVNLLARVLLPKWLRNEGEYKKSRIDMRGDGSITIRPPEDC